MGGGGGRSKPSGLLLFVCPGPGRLLGRAARTAVTSAQNAGRLDSYAAAGKLGIKLKKEWLATLDGRTRHAHALLDGQQRETSEPFEAEGEKLQFPGDPAAAGWMVYNCRCTMAAVVTGADGRALGGSAQRWVRDPVTGQGVRIEDMSFGEWAEWKEQQIADQRQFAEIQTILGQNAPKTFADFQNLKYTDTWTLFEVYKWAVQVGELTPLANFDTYQQISKEIDRVLVGLRTLNGLCINGKSNHFIARVIGSVEQKRSGISIEDILEALTNLHSTVFPIRENPDGKTSQKFRYGHVEVTVNPKTGILIQVNPKKE